MTPDERPRATRAARGAFASSIARAAVIAASAFSFGPLGAFAQMPAQAPRPPIPPQPPATSLLGELQVCEGIVRIYLVNEYGDVDGVLAEDGTQVRFPPHMGPDLVRTLKPGDRFTAQGDGTAGGGFRAYALGKVGRQPLVEARPTATTTPLPSPEMRAASLVRMQVDGVVANVLRAPHGEIDGVVLDDNTIVRLPPRNAFVDAAVLRAGARLSARGFGTPNAFGRSIRAENVGVDGGAMIALQPRGPEVPRPPRVPASPSSVPPSDHAPNPPPAPTR